MELNGTENLPIEWTNLDYKLDLEGRQFDAGLSSGVSTLIGQIAKTVVYSGATLARLNNRLLCPLLSQDSERGKDNEQSPTLYIFNDPLSPDRAYRIYANDQVSESMLEEAGIEQDQMTFMFVHGWLGGIHNELWLAEAKEAAVNLARLRLSTDEPGRTFRPNVIVVDWSELALGSLYVATQNSHKVSRRLAKLLVQLETIGHIKPELIHCIGHSIGLHICGKAAREAFPDPITRISSSEVYSGKVKKMGRISGLDPGGFCYELDIGRESIYSGLKPSDALITDAYYTNRSPFGNKYQVAQFNVRINNAFLQQACSVWRNSSVAKEYFGASVKFLFGTSNHNDILTCDHYFGTRFAYESFDKTPACSNVGYSCDSYTNFLKGRCGLCDTSEQCYSMDFEYQRSKRASVEHALKHITKNYNYTRNWLPHIDTSLIKANEPIDGINYKSRSVYYMRAVDDASRCTQLYRVRVLLDKRHTPVGLRLRLRFLNSDGNTVTVIDSYAGKETNEIQLHGPWGVNGRDSAETQTSKFGVDDCTLTALIELPAPMMVEEFSDNVKLATVLDVNTRLKLDSVLSIRVDYLSASNRK